MIRTSFVAFGNITQKVTGVCNCGRGREQRNPKNQIIFLDTNNNRCYITHVIYHHIFIGSRRGMTPPRVSFNKEDIISAAYELVRSEGFAALSARRLAQKLGSSVAPVYRVFKNMDELSKLVLLKAKSELLSYADQTYTSMLFLNVGTGIIMFARDEPQLFSALFLNKHQFKEVIADFQQDVLMRMSLDESLQPLSPASHRAILNRIWPYTLGLAITIMFGLARETSNEFIINNLIDAGFIIIYTEYAGLENMHRQAEESARALGVKPKEIDHCHKQEEA